MLRKQKIWNNFKNNNFENLNRHEAKELAVFTFEPNAGGLTKTWNSRSPDNNWVQRLDNSATPSLISHILFFSNSNFCMLSSAVARGGAGGARVPPVFLLKSKNRPV